MRIAIAAIAALVLLASAVVAAVAAESTDKQVAAASSRASFTADTVERFDGASGVFTADGEVTFKAKGKSASFDAQGEGQVTNPGTPSFDGTNAVITGRVSKGEFSTTAQKPGTTWFGEGPGTFVAQDENRQNIITGNGTDSGLVLVMFKGRGKVCAEFSEDFMGSANATGTFRTVGGKGDAASFKAKGNFTSVLQPDGSYTTDTEGKARILNKPKKMPQECKDLQSL